LSAWPNEVALWRTHPEGTRFLRLDAGGAHDVVDGVSRPVHFKPLTLMPDARRAMDELHREITRKWPNRARETTA